MSTNFTWKFHSKSMQTLAIQSADLSVQTESNNKEPVTGPDNSEVGGVVALQAQVEQLKKEVAKLVFENNRYHFAISNCTFRASDDVTPDASISLDASIKASTPVSSALPSSGLGPALFTRTIPALMSLTVQDMRQAKVDNNVKKSKNKTFISRMVKTLDKLETKYLAPRHKRKRRQFTNKQNTSPMTPKTQASSIYYVLSAPEPEKFIFPEPFHHVKWDVSRFKPPLPYPELCPFHSCSPDHEIYEECNYGTDLFPSLAAKNSVDCSNVTKPNLSSDSSGLQSEYESTSKPMYSGDESNTSLSTIPLSQGFQRVICNHPIDIVPTARNSSADVSFTDVRSVFSTSHLRKFPDFTQPCNQPHSQVIHHDAVGGRGRGPQGGLRGRRDRERRGAPDS